MEEKSVYRAAFYTLGCKVNQYETGKLMEKFAKNGYDIAITYVANVNKEELEKHFNELGAKLLLVESDVSNFVSCEEATKKIMDEFGRIDVLVNNAGITKDNLLLRMPEEDFDKVISVNLKGTFNMCKHVSSVMMKQKHGKIVNISSVFVGYENSESISLRIPTTTILLLS